ncbi:MAG: VCBS repeat-containing protein [Myxococcales bacterium]|jgi:hypothetical protein
MRLLQILVLLLATVLSSACQEEEERAPSVPSGVSTGSGSDRERDRQRDAGADPGSDGDAQDGDDEDAGAAPPLGEACDPGSVEPAQTLDCGESRAPLGCGRLQRTAASLDLLDAFATTDINGDGRADVLALDGVDGNGLVRLSGPDGLSDGCSQESGVAADGAPVALGDLDGDGTLDAVRGGCLVAGCPEAGRLEVHLGNGAGQLELSGAFDADDDGMDVERFGRPLLVDVDDDGADEVFLRAQRREGGVASAPTYEPVILILDFADGALTEASRFEGLMNDALLHAIDADGDGDLDVVGVSHDPENPSALPLAVDVALLQDGTIQRVAENGFVQLYTTSAPQSVVRDFDGDGVADVAVAVGTSGTRAGSLVTLRGREGGVFEQVSLLPGRVEAVAHAGRDADCGTHYLAAAVGSEVLLVEVGADLQATVVDRWDAGGELVSLGAADFDGDGTTELLGALDGSSSLGVWVPGGCP